MNHTIKVVIRLEKKSAVTNEAPICLRIILDRKTTYKTLFKIKPEFWDEKKVIVKKSHPNASEYNAKISKEKNDLEKDILLMDMSEKRLTIDSIRRKINNPISTDFFDYAQKYVEGLYKVGNASLYKRYNTVVSKFKRYLATDKLPIKNFTAKTVLDYEKFLSETLMNKNNTITANMKVLSKLVKDIYKEYRLDQYSNPFIDYKFKSDETTRNTLDKEEIIRIMNLKFVPSNPLYDAKQVFLFECFTGIRISDILTLKWKNLEGEHLSFNMRKTKQTITIPAAKPVMDIINKKSSLLLKSYETIPQEKYIFNILKQDIDTLIPMDAHNAISSATAVINKHLKKIALKAKIYKNISTHCGRHSFATNLISENVDVYIIMNLLGHKDIKVTQLYAKVRDTKKDIAISCLNW